MNIPTHQDLFQPLLKLLCHKQLATKKECLLPLAKTLMLTNEQLEQKYASGNGYIFAGRVGWALTYLHLSGLLERPKKGHYQINRKGQQLAEQSSEAILAFVKQQMAKRKQADFLPTEIKSLSTETTPYEQLEAAYQQIQQQIYGEILDTILSKTSSAFEQLVVQLLQKMGYGDWGRVTKASRDGGIDGEIKEDVLGFGRIYIQAKRYQKDAVIGRQTVQSFVGAVLGLGGNSNKGVFITTARFSQDAIEEVNNHPLARIVLIDGLKLAEYIYHYELGIQIEQTFSIKKLDADFWDDMPNE